MAATTAVAVPVAVVIHRRIADDGFVPFSAWTARVGERLRTWPGFLGQDVVPPTPPTQVDWAIVQRFKDADTARAWLQSEDRAHLVDEVQSLFVGQEDLHLLADGGAQPHSSTSAMISYNVPREEEKAFLKWQRRIQAAEAKFPGFVRHKIERPLPGVHDDWLIVLNFDSEANMTAWIDSPERQALLAEGGRFGTDLSLRRTNYGFDFWFPSTAAPDPHLTFKSNLLILLVLYPIVYLWTHFVDAPLISAHGIPFWLALFVGNIASTQLLGWWVAPAAFKLFDWWLPSTAPARRQIAGYALLAVLYALSMAAFAWLSKYPV
jgi:antibiotic biosynthesis monooxygenase (ABM) superfamily enzyme